MTQIYHIYSIYQVFNVYVPVQRGNTHEYTSTQVEILTSIGYLYICKYSCSKQILVYENTHLSASIDSGALMSTHTHKYILGINLEFPLDLAHSAVICQYLINGRINQDR